MNNITTENTFETAIINHLVENGGYKEENPAGFSRELAFDKITVLDFLQDTQPLAWEKLKAIHGESIHSRIIQRLFKELDLRGTLDVLRHGFIDYSIRFQMAYFKPESQLNPDTLALYNKNRLTVTRQIKYSLKGEQSIDLLLSLNGLPVATVELKNQFTDQDVSHARQQYIQDRDPRELLFQFNKRALVHFAVDQDEVYMTTRLDGKKTRYLPFNKGYDHGAGNPPNGNGYKTSYLWQNIWEKDSWMDIIGKFLHLQSEEVFVENKRYKKETLIFPRFHQLNVVRKLTDDARQNGVGKNYLIQHSAGSGKSNSIAWLAYRLFSLHNEQDERVFDSVIVITDRRVLDQQLQNTIYQFEHKSGVVQKIEKDSKQLAYALGSGSNIIITTLQKFPFVAILDEIKNLPHKKYAVIVDEAHSSQGGEASKKLKEVLSAKNLKDAEKQDQPDEEDIEDEIRKSMEARGRQENLSFFAFTATPKPKTLQVFGVEDAEGKPQAFDTYSMRQAIEEGFILDVLKNYMTYQTYFRLSKQIEDDPQLNKKKAARAIARFVSLHPHNLAQKTEVMVEHFRQITAKKIGGKAKAMVVTSSRLHAKRYFSEFKEYIKQKGYNFKVLVAFSGKVVDDDFPDGVSEPQLTGYGEKELPTVFDSPEYQILLVADKYQYGFDQPLLHTMFVDKKLSGVRAVQTLSRLNRTHPGKEDTFVLDFVNDRQTILDSFQPYYEQTGIEETTDPNHLYDLKETLDKKQVYWQSEIDTFATIFFKSRQSLTYRDQGKLYACTDPAVDRFRGLTGEEQDEFKKGLRTWVNLYSFLSQIIPFRDIELEKFYAFAKLLFKRLPKDELSEKLKLTDEVALEYYRLQKIAEGAIQLEKQGQVDLPGVTEAGIKRDKAEFAYLSEIIEILNKRFGTDFDDADKLFFEQIEQELVEDEKLQSQAKNNTIDNFKYGFEEIFIAKLIDRMEDNQEIFEKILDDKTFGDVVKKYMLEKVYHRLTQESEKPN